MSDLHEAYEAIFGPAERQPAQRSTELESTVRLGNLVIATEQGWIPPEAA